MNLVVSYKSRHIIRIYPNLLSAEMVINGPPEHIINDMMVLRVRGVYHELTLYIWIYETMRSLPIHCQQNT